jgi:hypothetical protein
VAPAKVASTLRGTLNSREIQRWSRLSFNALLEALGTTVTSTMSHRYPRPSMVSDSAPLSVAAVMTEGRFALLS